ncbi:MAG: hypothetical protein ACI85O_000268 [Saprospiraceae bacterium]|jgi:uncharacterized protein (DUF1800 family)
MDRRTTLATLFGRKNIENKSTAVAEMPATVLTSLAPYTGTFGFTEAAHLLRRTTFAPTKERINAAVDAGLENTLAQIFQIEPLPEPPVIYYNPTMGVDPNVAVGETWVNTHLPVDNIGQIRFSRRASLYAWTFGLALNEGVSIREKLTLFWHNHFVTAEINDPKFGYHYYSKLRENALGNFRELTKIMTVDPAMLRYLNGNQNTENAPNENYARELLELFTIGKGPQVAPGDYTTYTEDDVITCAKILTGWRDRGHNSTDPAQNIDIEYVQSRHDTTDKELSYRFGNQIITNNDAEEYKDLIDLIFTKEEVAKNICRKLYRWFVYYAIDDQIEMDIIEPMAQMMIDNNYDVQASLDALFRSEHFFDMLNFGPMIKNPMDFVVSALKVNKVPILTDLQGEYGIWFKAGQILSLLDMPVMTPPTVAGYAAYYQEPTYYRVWVNSATLSTYKQIMTGLAGDGLALTNNISVQIDVLTFVQELDNPSDPNALITELAGLLFPQPITEGQRDFLKTILINGLPDFEWTVEYGSWASDPENSDLTASVEAKLRALWTAMMTMPEYFLS